MHRSTSYRHTRVDSSRPQTARSDSTGREAQTGSLMLTQSNPYTNTAQFLCQNHMHGGSMLLRRSMLYMDSMEYTALQPVLLIGDSSLHLLAYAAACLP
jgi:hypothetical protein